MKTEFGCHQDVSRYVGFNFILSHINDSSVPQLSPYSGEGGMFQENSIETCILSRVKQITSPGWMHETSARTWCTGKTQRDRVEREVGGGNRMGNTCKPMAVSFQCMTKSTKKKKKKNRRKNSNIKSFPKIKKKKRKQTLCQCSW